MNHVIGGPLVFEIWRPPRSPGYFDFAYVSIAASMSETLVLPLKHKKQKAALESSLFSKISGQLYESTAMTHLILQHF